MLPYFEIYLQYKLGLFNFSTVVENLFGPHKQLCELQDLHPHARA